MAYTGPVIHMGTNESFFAGYNAGNNSISGTANTGVGIGAGLALTSGSTNTLCGYNCGTAITSGSNNTAVGTCLQAATTGANNTIAGAATFNSGNGSYNIIIGSACAANYTGTESSNIIIGEGITGTASESNVTRIGNGTGTGTGQQNKCFISGIYGITTTSSTTSTVLVSNGNQLGTVSSSIRFKENVQDMGEVSEKILKFRPVTFNYKIHKGKYTQYGLIAEEVYEVMPEIVNLDEQGKPFSVRYHDLPIMILNELQKRVKRIEELEAKLNGI